MEVENGEKEKKRVVALIGRGVREEREVFLALVVGREVRPCWVFVFSLFFFFPPSTSQVCSPGFLCSWAGLTLPFSPTFSRVGVNYDVLTLSTTNVWVIYRILYLFDTKLY